MSILQAFGPTAGRLAAPAACGRSVGGGAPLWRAADALARMERARGARNGAALCPDREGGALGRVAVLRPLCEGDQRAQEGAQRRHPRSQLPDAGNLQLRCRLRRRLAAARARSVQGRRRHHRAMRRALHGRDLEDPEPREDGTHSRPQGRLFARVFDHRRGCAPAAPEIPWRAGRRLCEHLRRREGRGRHLLHLIECNRGGRKPWRRHRDLPARPVSRELRRRTYQGEDHRLEGRLRSARAFHRRGATPLSRGRSRPCRSSRIRNARRMCWRNPTIPARPQG